MSIEAVIFDLDGTLFDETNYLKAVLQFFVEQQNMDVDDIPSFQLPNLRSKDNDILKQLLILIGAQVEGNHSTLFHLYSSISISIPLFSGVERLLTEIKSSGRKVGLLTNGVVGVQENKVACLEIQKYFDDIQYARCFGAEFEKPHQDSFFRACSALNSLPDKTLMVGDNWTNDIEGASAAGLKTYYVGPKYVGKSHEILDLPTWLKNNEN